MHEQKMTRRLKRSIRKAKVQEELRRRQEIAEESRPTLVLSPWDRAMLNGMEWGFAVSIRMYKFAAALI